MGNIATFPQVSTIQEYLRNPGLIGYGELTADQTVGSGAYLNGCNVTVTVSAGRRIKITASIQYVSTVANDEAIFMIMQGASSIKQSWHTSTVANRFYADSSEIILTPTAGTHTFSLYLSRNSGSGTFTALGSTASRRCAIIIEDISGDATAVNPQSVPVGALGYGIQTVSQTGIAAGTYALLTSMSVNVTVPAGRVLKISSFVCFSQTGTGTVESQIVQNGVKIARWYDASVASGEINSLHHEVIVSPAAGTHTFAANLNLAATGQTYAGTDAPNLLVVEDITPTPAPASSVPSSTLGYAQAVANQGSIGGSATDLTGLSVTVTVPAGRRLRITGFADSWTSTVGSDRIIFRVAEDGVEVARELALTEPIAGNAAGGGSVIAVRTPSAGTHTYKLQAETADAGTATLQAANSRPAFILVEDITGVSIPALARTGLWTPANDFPASPGIGDIFYEVDNETLWVWKGSAWYELSAPTYAARATSTVATDIPNGVATKITFDGETYDYKSCFDLVNDRYVAPRDGLYECSGTYNYGGGANRCSLTLRRNGVDVSDGSHIHHSVNQSVTMTIYDIITMSAGQYVELFGHNVSGSGTATGGVNGNTGIPRLVVRRIGPQA